MPRARGLKAKVHQIGAALLLSAHPVSSPTTDKPQASTTVTVSNNLSLEAERASPQKYRPFDAPLLPQFPTVRPRFEKLHLDDLRDSQAPAVSEAPSQYLGPQAPRIIHPKRFRSNLRKSQEVGFSVRLARARARSNAPFPQQRHHLHDVQTHCATTPAPFGAIAKTSTNCTRKK